MAAVYRVGDKWRADFIDKDGIRHRQRFTTKGDAEDFLIEKKVEIKEGVYVAPKNIPAFATLADEWIAARIELSRTPGSGYRPSTLAQWQSHIAHIKLSVGATKATKERPEASISTEVTRNSVNFL